MGWLMHELTHQWQFQHDGLIYLFQAMFLSPTYVYAPRGEPVNIALRDFSNAGKVFRNFNREQQGDIVRDYYFHMQQNDDVSAWDGYLKDLRQPPRKGHRRDVTQV